MIVINHIMEEKNNKKILKYLTASATLIMDDIQDNIFFKNFVEKNKLKYHVFHYQEKYVGLIENIGLQINNPKKKLSFSFYYENFSYNNLL